MYNITNLTNLDTKKAFLLLTKYSEMVSIIYSGCDDAKDVETVLVDIIGYKYSDKYKIDVSLVNYYELYKKIKLDK